MVTNYKHNKSSYYNRDERKLHYFFCKLSYFLEI